MEALLLLARRIESLRLEYQGNYVTMAFQRPDSPMDISLLKTICESADILNGIRLKPQLDHFGHYGYSLPCLLPHLWDQQKNAFLGSPRILSHPSWDIYSDLILLSC